MLRARGQGQNRRENPRPGGDEDALPRGGLASSPGLCTTREAASARSEHGDRLPRRHRALSPPFWL